MFVCMYICVYALSIYGGVFQLNILLVANEFNEELVGNYPVFRLVIYLCVQGTKPVHCGVPVILLQSGYSRVVLRLRLRFRLIFYGDSTAREMSFCCQMLSDVLFCFSRV
jgi:hypothetical protein